MGPVTFFTMMVLARCGSVVASSHVQTFQGYCLDAAGQGYNYCGQYANSGEDCKRKLLASSTAVGANYVPSYGVCDLRYPEGANVETDGSCHHEASGRPAHGYPVRGDGDGGATCYAKVPPIKVFKGYCLDAAGQGYNYCGQYANSGEDCKRKLLASNTAVGANYVPSYGVCDLRYPEGANVETDGSCHHEASGRPAHGYPVRGDGDGGATCYAKAPALMSTMASVGTPTLLLATRTSISAILGGFFCGALMTVTVIAFAKRRRSTYPVEEPFLA